MVCSAHFLYLSKPLNLFHMLLSRSQRRQFPSRTCQVFVCLLSTTSRYQHVSTNHQFLLTVLVMPSVNRVSLISPSSCSHSGNSVNTSLSAEDCRSPLLKEADKCLKAGRLPSSAAICPWFIAKVFPLVRFETHMIDECEL